MVFIGLLLGFKVQGFGFKFSFWWIGRPHVRQRFQGLSLPPWARDLKYRLPLKSMPRRYD